ncbi:MAG TPA: Stk1 family PASTA domain-containing Ser/Thr kinase [Solirubrobacteraceae bacterium]|jgi:serine/threonine-protein kinase
MIEPETIIDGRYRVVSRLGSGGMAEVYLARDELLGREVAVKVLHQHFAEDQEFVERFRREASSAAGLSHPNIVAIFDRGEWNGTYYIAMEYVDGRSLKALVREHGALEPSAALEIVIQILRAARFAHRRGVIHRDLKPHNVLLDDEGRARVTDFGIARAGASDMTMTGSIMGTAQYLSPEQAQGFAVSATSDIYSVGVILYELLTGVVPFEGETAVAIAFKQVSAVPTPPSTLNPALPASLDAVVLRALAKDPAERYADAEELIAALEAERASLAGQAQAQAPAPVLTRTHGAGEDPAVAAPAAAFPPTGSMLLHAPPLGPEEEAIASARRGRWAIWTLALLLVAGAIVAAVLLLGGKTKTVRVPSVLGQTEQAAGAKLRAAGLASEPSLRPNANVAAGLVVSQSPRAGAKIAKGSTVSVVISSGPKNEPLIDVEGLTVTQAKDRLSKAGFKPTTKSQASTTVAAGHVIGTDPSAGTVVVTGSPVTILVSSGPPPVKVPDLRGETLEQAETNLKGEELEVGTITKRVSTTAQPETVLAQSPAPGKKLHAGDKVNLVVARAPKEVPVPNVVGESEASAAAALGKAGFKPKTKPVETTEASQEGIVLSQSPEGSAEAPKGSVVTIGVGTLSTQTTTTTTTTTPSANGPTPPSSPSSG